MITTVNGEAAAPQEASSRLERRILIDGQNLALRHGTGIATYSRQVVKALRTMGCRVDVAVGGRFAPHASDSSVNRARLDEGAAGWQERLVPSRLLDYARGLMAVPLGVTLGPVDLAPPHLEDSDASRLSVADGCFVGRNLFAAGRQHAIRWNRLAPLRIPEGHAPDLFHAMQVTPLKLPNVPSVVTVHDIIPLVLPGSTTENLRHYRKVVQVILREADHIVTVSEHSRRDLIRHFGADEKRITNTYQTVELPDGALQRGEREIQDDLRFFGLEPDEYFLFVGAIEPKKNLKRLVDAYAGSGVRRPLVVVGGLGWNYDADLRAIEDERFLHYREEGGFIRRERQVRRLSYVPGPQLISLLRGARALLFPSLYEGFGLPVAEAMALGTPVMTSDATSLPEIAGDAALLVDPTDTFAMARAIRCLDQDHELRADLARRGPIQAARFSAAEHRRRLHAVYRSLL